MLRKSEWLLLVMIIVVITQPPAASSNYEAWYWHQSLLHEGFTLKTFFRTWEAISGGPSFIGSSLSPRLPHGVAGRQERVIQCHTARGSVSGGDRGSCHASPAPKLLWAQCPSILSQCDLASRTVLPTVVAAGHMQPQCK